MKFSTARAMQISFLDQEQIGRLHEVETRVGYCIPNWNIQKMFHLPEIKEGHMIPDNDAALARHSKRIEAELNRCNVYMGSGGWVDALGLESTHKFDWAVNAHKDNIIWEHSSGRKRSVLEKLEKNG